MPFKRQTLNFRQWWQAPATSGDRLLGAVVGRFGGLWIGALGRIAFGPTPVSLGEVAVFAVIAATCGAGLGVAFPKPVTVVLFPLSLFGGGH